MSEVKLIPDEIWDHLEYDPETDKFRWRAGGAGKRVDGVAGTVDPSNGYLQVMFRKTTYYGHRLVWFWHTGEQPPPVLDHVNGDKLDNRIENLRPASHTQNLHNSKMRSDNTSGTKGVYWKKDKRKWAAYGPKFGGRVQFLGHFTEKAAAVLAARLARESQSKEFANHG